MKKSAGMLLTVAIFLSAAAAFAKEIPTETKFDGTLYHLDKHLDLSAIQVVKGNIDGNKYDDTVTLVVERDKANNAIERMWFEVRPGHPLNTPDAEIPSPFLVPLPEHVRGFDPVMELHHFIPGGTEQVFLTWDEGDRGPRAFSVVEIRTDDVRRDARLLFDSRTMARAILNGEFIGKFRATLHIEDTKTETLFDLSGKKDFYVKHKIYDSRGKLLKPVAIRAKKYDNISLGARDASGITQLQTIIELYGLGDDDHLATIRCGMRYDPEFASWKIRESRIEPAPGVKFAETRK